MTKRRIISRLPLALSHAKTAPLSNTIHDTHDFDKQFDDRALWKALDKLPKSKLSCKPVLHFVHANGIVGECYAPLFKIWQKYFTIIAITRFGMNPNYSIDNHWHDLTNEVADSIEHACMTHGISNLIAVGHSVGAMTSLQATLRNHSSINQLVALDPPLLMGRNSILWHLAKYIDWQNGNHAMMDSISPSKHSKHRRTTFDDRKQAYDSLRHKGLFKNFDERSFQAYINFGMSDTPSHDKPNQVSLSISRDAEVAIFRTIPTWAWYQKCKTTTPITIVAGSTSHFTKMGSYHLAQQLFEFNLCHHQGSHMFPLEQPDSVANLVLDLIIKQTNQSL